MAWKTWCSPRPLSEEIARRWGYSRAERQRGAGAERPAEPKWVARRPSGVDPVRAAASAAGRPARRAHPTLVGLPLRPFRPVERPAEQSRQAASSRRCGKKRGPGRNAIAATKAKPPAPVLLSPQRPPVPRDERVPQRGKSELREGWAEHRISLVRAEGMRCEAVGSDEAFPAAGGNRRVIRT